MMDLRAIGRRALTLAADPRSLLCVYLLVTVSGSLQKYWSGHISNFRIFRTSAVDLVLLRDLYRPHQDVYHYTPTFSFFMIPFASIPIWAGITLWNLLNALPLFWAVQRLPLSNQQRAAACWIILWEALTCIQNQQSNALLAALFLWAFIALEGGGPFRAACWIMLSAFIKVFGAAEAVLLLFYRRKGRAVLSLGCWLVVFAALPWLVVPLDHLAGLYGSWAEHVRAVQRGSYGISVMGILHTWFGATVPNAWVQLIGAVGLCCPLLRFGRYASLPFRQRFLASAMIWVVLFNHKAESPSFVIAMVGVALWFVLGESTGLRRGLLALALLGSFYPDLTPRWLRETYITPYALKAVPYLLVWLKLQHELLAGGGRAEGPPGWGRGAIARAGREGGSPPPRPGDGPTGPGGRSGRHGGDPE